ncbi:MAG: hypothetical protein KAQ94_01310 [Arcobacteraceae bacterium]|nr:hypothetical protein [Arcobacteraceae bacterium]
MFQGLSTDQAPPISVPFRFFLTAPLFGILISLVLLFYPIEEVFNRYSPVSVGLIHLFTLGMLSMIIFGALQQMLPVLAGAVFKRPLIFANIVHLSLVAGTLSLSGGFIFSSKMLLIAGSAFLSISFGVFFVVLLRLLFQVKYLTSTVNTMKLFAIAGAVTALLGLYLIGQHISGNINSYHYFFVNTHILFAGFGFAVILVMGVAFQVVPMFYVAPDFPKNIQEKFPRVILGMSVLAGIFLIFQLDWQLIKIIIATFVSIFAYYGLNSLNNRRRPVFDVTLWYWKFSFYSLIFSQVLFLFFDNMVILSLVFIFGFLYSLLQGMIYKIIPFLAWFHLSSRGHFSIPNLREYIKEDMIKLQFFIYISSFAFFILSAVFNQLFLYIASVLFLISNLMFLFNLITAIRKYNSIAKTDPMGAFKMETK